MDLARRALVSPSSRLINQNKDHHRHLSLSLSSDYYSKHLSLLPDRDLVADSHDPRDIIIPFDSNEVVDLLPSSFSRPRYVTNTVFFSSSISLIIYTSRPSSDGTKKKKKKKKKKRVHPQLRYRRLRCGGK